MLIINSENYELKEALKIAKLKSELEIEYYNKMKKNIAETRKINHDISNMIMTAKSIDDNSDRNNMLIQELTETLEKNKIRKFCENELVNIILINKYDLIRENNIDFSTNLNIPNSIKIKDIDLCRIITNMIDNATESCINSLDKTRRFIVFNAKIKEDNLIIKCSNYCEKVPVTDGKKLKSTKAAHSGLGVEILKSITADYNGDFVTDFADNTFTAVAMVNI